MDSRRGQDDAAGSERGGRLRAGVPPHPAASAAPVARRDQGALLSRHEAVTANVGRRGYLDIIMHVIDIYKFCINKIFLTDYIFCWFLINEIQSTLLQPIIVTEINHA